LKTAALASAVSFRGADQNRSGAYTIDLKGKVDRLKAEKGRGKLVKDAEDVYALIDSLIICKNAKGTLYKELADMAKLYNVVTGVEMTPEELSIAGERIITLAKLINVREGLGRKDDTLPWKVMNQPIPDDGPVKGAVVTQDELDLLLDDYYQARGWNVEGIPTKAKLQELGMQDYQNITEAKEA
jgi:aldehyde:ferredoxin oxidoreductase